MILKWRKSPRVAKRMNTVIDHGVEEQEKWILACRERADFYHWLIRDHGDDVGYLSLDGYDPGEKTASWGFYVGEEERVGLGGLVPPPFYNFCFGKLGIERLDAEVLYFNTEVIDLHRLHGYRFTPQRDRILTKGPKKMLLVSMSLDRNTFLEGRFARFQAEFPTRLWNPSTESPSTPSLRFEKVEGTPEQVEVLLDLLRNRRHPISHHEAPSPEEHKRFVTSHPYRIWWIVRDGASPIGAAYLTKENSVGINLTKDDSGLYLEVIEKIRAENQPLPEIPSMRPGFLFLNVAPGNRSLTHALEKLGAVKTQSSFRI